MTLTAPSWLAQRGGSLKLGSDGRTWFVVLADQPNYSLQPVPVQGKFGCAIRHTNSGRRLDSPAVFPSKDEALAGGLEDLRKGLGWE